MDHGTFRVVPSSDPNAIRQTFTGTYPAGSLVTLISIPDPGYRTIWSGTDNDASKGNTVVTMWSDKDVELSFDQARTIVVGSDPNYTTIQHAIHDAGDGDVVIIPTGTYASPYPGTPPPIITIVDKSITLTGKNPDDPCVVAATVLEDYYFNISNAGPGTVIDGLTLRDCHTYLYWSAPTIRNCVFTECRVWGLDGGNITDYPDDGTDGASVEGGAIEMYNSSPLLQNCTFNGCSVTGGDGGNGNGGHDGHSAGYDGGWGGWAYGGAVFCGDRSSPRFESCSFINGYAQGGNGGNGGGSINNAHGGRGGLWQWDPTLETGPYTYPDWYWWDGWQYADYDENGDYRSFDEPYGYYKDYWKYSGYGGAVYCENDSSPKFLDCTFTDNQTYGGVCGVGGNRWPTPDRNLNIENFGGAVYACYRSNPEFVNCSFNNNVADTSTVTSPDDIIVSYGGSVAFEDDCELKFTNCIISSGEACRGGGIYGSIGSLTIVDCNLSDNMAYHGAGLYSVDIIGTISQSIFADNNAFGAYVAPDPNTPIEVFGRGGGYYCLTSIVDINDSIFTRNWAQTSGGALYYIGSDLDLYDRPLLHNCLLTDNSAGRDGGAVSSNLLAEPLISNCTIAENEVTGDAGVGYSPCQLLRKQCKGY
jgi:hypothetical protein